MHGLVQTKEKNLVGRKPVTPVVWPLPLMGQSDDVEMIGADLVHHSEGEPPHDAPSGADRVWRARFRMLAQAGEDLANLRQQIVS
jgi:hypothetical protein